MDAAEPIMVSDHARVVADLLGGTQGVAPGTYAATCPCCRHTSQSLVIFAVGPDREHVRYLCSRCSATQLELEIRVRMIETREPDMVWINTFKLTETEVAQLIDPNWIYENLIIQSHLIAIPAAPGAGKTTIMMHVAGEIAADYQVCYVNADVGSGDVKVMQTLADAKGFHLLLPDMKAGLSMDDVVNKIVAMNQHDADYSNYVFFFDTLKKMVDVISKSRAKDLYKILRGLTAKGMTIVLNAHTNKYTDADGRPIYEGTGDLRSDVDDLIYLIPKKNPDGSMTVSTDPDKRRGNHQPITFEIAPDRTVTRTDYIDTTSQVQADKQREADSTVIESVTEAIQKGSFRQTEIVDWCREHHGIGRRSTEAVLRRYMSGSNRLWNRERGFKNNTWIYRLNTEKCGA